MKKIIAVLAFFVFASFNFVVTPSADNSVEISAAKKVEAGYGLFEKRKEELEKDNANSKAKQEKDKLDETVTKIQKDLEKVEKEKAKDNQPAPKFSGLG